MRTLPLLGILLTLLLTACGTTATASALASTGQTSLVVSTPSPQNSPPSGATALQLLVKSFQAMSQIKTVHVTVTSKGTILSSGGALPALPQQQKLSYALKVTNAAIAVTSQQEQGQLQFVLNPQGPNTTTFAYKEVVSGKTLYSTALAPSAQKSKKGTAAAQWTMIDLAQLLGQQQMLTAGIQPQDLLGLLQRITMADKGTVTLKGVRVHHITITLDQPGLDQLVANTTQPMVKQILGSIKLQSPLQVDVFIDETTSLLHHVAMKGNLSVNVDQVAGKGSGQQSGAQPRTLQITMNSTVTFSKYGQPVQIKVPSTKTTSAPGANAA